MRRNPTAVVLVYYLALLAVVAGILFQFLPVILPSSVAVRIGHNSEGLVLALLVALWIQYARPRLVGTPRQWALTLAVGAVCIGIAVLLLMSDLPSRFRTLNETFFAAGLLLPYLQARRPLPARLAASVTAAVLALIVIGEHTLAVTDLAEMLAVLLLAPIGFDVIDRGILDPTASTSTSARYCWFAFLVVAPIVFSVLQYQIGVTGLLGEVTRYAVRTTEAFVCMLLVELYFAVGLGRASARRRPRVGALGRR